MSGYVPVTLPPLPRVRCPWQGRRMTLEPGLSGTARITAKPCTGAPLANGWCEQHQYVQQLLDYGHALGYPLVWLNMHLWIGRGCANWEAYAVRYPARRQSQVNFVVGQLYKKQVCG